MSGRRHTILFYIFLCCLACSKEETPRQFAVEVPDVVQPYIDQFLSEAANRDQQIDLTNHGLVITFQDNLEDSLAAFCSAGTINISQRYWDTRNEASREAMIFHELGHCILDRSHLNTLLPNDEWFSIMRGDPLPESKSGAINFTGIRRQYYIDELFDRNTPEPSWIHIPEDYALRTDSRDTFFHTTNSGGFSRSMGLPDSSDYEIEVLADFQKSNKLVGLAWGGEEIQDQIVLHFNAERTFVINAGLYDQGIIYDREDFGLLDPAINLITMRRRGDKYLIFINKQFAYWMDVKIPEVKRFQVLAAIGGAPNFLAISVFELLSN